MSYSQFQGLGATGHRLPDEQLHRTVAALAKLNQTTQQVVDKYVAETPILSRYTVQEEWAKPFKASVEADVARMLAPTSSGFYIWEKRPQVLANLSRSIDEQIKDMQMYREELLEVSGNLKKLASALAKGAKEAALEATKEALDLMEESLAVAAKKPLGAIVAVGGVALLIGVLYLVKK